MATNQRQNVRNIYVPAASITALTTTQILELIQAETLGGVQADVSLLQIGDMVYISPSDVPANTIDDPHGTLAPAAPTDSICRIFMVVDFRGVPTSEPAQRHALKELATVGTPLFW